MSTKSNNDEWGNISLPGLSDEQLYGTNWDRKAIAQDLLNDPKWVAAQKNAVQSESHRDLKSKQTKELWENEEFRNRQLENFRSEELRKLRSEKQKQNYQNPAYRSKLSASLAPTYVDPARNNKISKSRKKFLNENPDQVEAMRQRLENVTDEQRQKGIEKRNQNEAWVQHAKNLGKRRRKPIMTPAGRFESKGEAAKHFNKDPAAIGYWITKDPSNWYYIDT